MFKEAEAFGLPEPEIVEVGMLVRFIVYLAESINTQISMKATEQVAEQVNRLLFCLKRQLLLS
ncbi:hypothetical protein [Methanosarcina sp. WH1]|uniref:hypothetical protein n=1 Tax=Methanosarcina sp. WH1 TaxID=1434102 RepID=UPI00064E6E17|nr:hypothetical protein [Methanosarcina sp. WH1]